MTRVDKAAYAPLRLELFGVLPVVRIVVEAVLRRQDGRALRHMVAAYVHILQVSRTRHRLRGNCMMSSCTGVPAKIAYRQDR